MEQQPCFQPEDCRVTGTKLEPVFTLLYWITSSHKPRGADLILLIFKEIVVPQIFPRFQSSLVGRIGKLTFTLKQTQYGNASKMSLFYKENQTITP